MSYRVSVKADPVARARFAAALGLYFDPKTWNPAKHGLIYTDPGFLKALRHELVQMGFAEAGVRRVQYSEQGMQGDDYVSLDVFQPFVREWLAKHGKRPRSSESRRLL